MVDTIREATLSIAEEFRKMEVGESVSFPLEKYNYNSVRVAPTTTLMKERILEGKRWTTNIDYDNKYILVTRTA